MVVVVVVVVRETVLLVVLCPFPSSCGPQVPAPQRDRRERTTEVHRRVASACSEGLGRAVPLPVHTLPFLPGVIEVVFKIPPKTSPVQELKVCVTCVGDRVLSRSGGLPLRHLVPHG
ncbi:hypothetical protein E2C01_032145 [Portunus trituberculatus]|uniref:Secreted protein n=1 Tax=Portunus trituberculatus TaxID=210409 RepID=A0A5B7F212_PORTR|nr:hypothetical protein [Portunus trituberculatus]